MSDYLLHISLAGTGVCLCLSEYVRDKLSETKSWV